MGASEGASGASGAGGEGVGGDVAGAGVTASSEVELVGGAYIQVRSSISNCTLRQAYVSICQL